MERKRLSCHNEYDSLHKVILCSPKYMKMIQVTNESQRRCQKSQINVKKAVKQHLNFLEVLRKNGIETHLMPAKEEYPEQVFTRDIGFTIGETLFISDMKMPVRQGEEREFKTWLDDIGFEYIDVVEDEAEGGDILVHGDTVYIGLSDRTTSGAVERLESFLPNYNIVSMPIREDILHLDCILNIISESEALIHQEGLIKEDVDHLASKFELIDVTREEQITMGVNVLSIGNKKIISLPGNKAVNAKLRKRGYEVIEVEFDEIIKSGGSFRCCTLPLLRE
jgi:N-dimethylarginine dimethylaminohydrolase